MLDDRPTDRPTDRTNELTCELNQVAKRLASKALLGVGMIFLDRDPEVAAKIKDLVADAAKDSGFRVVAWRPVPVDESILGEASADTVPTIEQVVVAPIDEVSSSDSGAGALSFDDLVRDATEAASDEEGAYVPLNSGALERGLYLLRRRLRGYADEKGYDADSLYVASFSSRTMVRTSKTKMKMNRGTNSSRNSFFFFSFFSFLPFVFRFVTFPVLFLSLFRRIRAW